MTWTNTAPTQDGFFWYKPAPDERPIIVEVHGFDVGSPWASFPRMKFLGGATITLAYLKRNRVDALWNGPLYPPE